MPSWANNSTKMSNYIKLNKMEDTLKNNETAQLGIGAVSSRTIPQSLIKRAIGICECMKAAREAQVGVRVMRMYAAESDRITAEFREYGC